MTKSSLHWISCHIPLTPTVNLLIWFLVSANNPQARGQFLLLAINKMVLAIEQ